MAQFLDGVIEHAITEDVVPGIGEEPETGGHVRTHRRTFRPRGTFALTALHLLTHVRSHFVEINIADALLWHDSSLTGPNVSYGTVPHEYPPMARKGSANDAHQCLLTGEKQTRYRHPFYRLLMIVAEHAEHEACFVAG